MTSPDYAPAGCHALKHLPQPSSLLRFCTLPLHPSPQSRSAEGAAAPALRALPPPPPVSCPRAPPGGRCTTTDRNGHTRSASCRPGGCVGVRFVGPPHPGAIQLLCRMLPESRAKIWPPASQTARSAHLADEESRLPALAVVVASVMGAAMAPLWPPRNVCCPPQVTLVAFWSGYRGVRPRYNG
jgi:hypothetical protein